MIINHCHPLSYVYVLVCINGLMACSTTIIHQGTTHLGEDVHQVLTLALTTVGADQAGTGPNVTRPLVAWVVHGILWGSLLHTL